MVLGGRGLPARYGGFEELSSVLKTKLCSEGVNVEVRSSSREQRPLMSRSLCDRIGTLTGTFQSARQIVGARAVLVLNPVNVFTAMNLRRRNNFVVIHMDGRDDRRRKWPLVVQILYRWCQRLCVLSGTPLIFDSRTVRDEIGGRNPEKYAIIAYGGCQFCETERKVWIASHVSQTFISLARAEPENQLVEIVRSVSAMAAPVPLRVVTTTRHKGRYWNSLVAEVNESDSAELIDGIWDKEQLCSMYREVSAVIHGHTVGGTNPSLVLALCHGTPVFAHDNPYNREVAGSLARYWKDEQELTKLLDEFDPATWPYDQAAIDDFNRRYNWDDVVEKYKRLLGLDQSPSPGPSNDQ